jgi:hypothetical protein
MKANKARFALTLSLALALAACGGGGGGGGGDDDDDGGTTPPPSGFGDFNGSFTLRGTNPSDSSFATKFNATFPANFVNGRAMVGTPPNVVATEFDYPLNPQTGGCYYKRGAIDSCVERAEGKVLALCAAASDAEINSIGISDTRNASFAVSNDGELQAVALARNADFQLRSLNCANQLDANDTVSFRIDGSVIQRFGSSQEALTPTIVDDLFSDGGRSVGNPEIERVGAKAYKHTVGSQVTYYVVTFGAAAQGAPFPPKIFVSVN